MERLNQQAQLYSQKLAKLFGIFFLFEKENAGKIKANQGFYP